MNKYTLEQVRDELQRQLNDVDPASYVSLYEVEQWKVAIDNVLRERESAKAAVDVWLAQDWKWCPKCGGRWGISAQCDSCSFNAALEAVAPMLASARVPDELKSAPASPLHPLWGDGYLRGWNACRFAMLAAAPKPETEE